MSFLDNIIRLKNAVSGRSSGSSAREELLTYQTEGISERFLIHLLKDYHPQDLEFGFKTDDGARDESVIIDRLVAYYDHLEREAAAANVGENEDMWLFISKSHEPFRDALKAGDRPLLSHMLQTVATGNLVAGFMNFEPYSRLVNNERLRTIEAKQFIDKLLSLSEALGCSSIQGREQGRYGYSQIDVADLIARIKARATFDVSPPAAGGGTFGYKVDDQILCIKDLFAIYTALQCVALADRGGATIAEIGGGTGTLAYYLFKAGFDQISVYDLPIVSVIQGYYLMRSLGTDAVSLHGESPSMAKLKIKPYWAFQDESGRPFDVVVNQDSMPEIARDVAAKYMLDIKAKVRTFLSINQEGRQEDQFGNPQSVVFDLVEAAGGFQRLARYPYWMREGYVEEHYRIS